MLVRARGLLPLDAAVALAAVSVAVLLLLCASECRLEACITDRGRGREHAERGAGLKHAETCDEMWRRRREVAAAAQCSRRPRGIKTGQTKTTLIIIAAMPPFLLLSQITHNHCMFLDSPFAVSIGNRRGQKACNFCFILRTAEQS